MDAFVSPLGDVARTLLGGGTSAAGNLTDLCVCIPPHVMGTDAEHTAALGFSWIAFVVSLLILLFYGYHSWKATCGWEEVYVCVIELVKVTLEIFFEKYPPATITQINGVYTPWLRYGEWLLTCPVILIHLSNITGLQNDYNKRTMQLLISDIGTIVMGITAAFATGPTKIVFFLLGCCYAVNTFFHAAKVYIESYHEMPEGECRTLVYAMAWVFFISWFGFPILFLMGPEGFGHISPYGSIIGHTFVDLMSKNLWGFLGHHLRVKIHEHILIHGDIRKKSKVKVAGQEMEVETLCYDEHEDGAVRNSTAALARRDSFLTMRDNLKSRGFDIRASLDSSPEFLAAATGYQMDAAGGPGVLAVVQTRPPAAAAATGKGSMYAPSSPMTATAKGAVGAGAPAGSAGEPVRVVLGVLDADQVDYFKEQFFALPVPAEVVPALGGDAVLAVAGQAEAFGGADCCLLHPEYLRDRSSSGVVARLRAMGQRVCAYGWAQSGPDRELIDAADLDGWLEGPSWGAGINTQQLATLLLQMQAQRLNRAATGAFGAAIRSLTPLAAFGNLTSAAAAAGGASPTPSPMSTATNPLFSTGMAAAAAAAPGSPCPGLHINTRTATQTPAAAQAGTAAAAAAAAGLNRTGSVGAAAGTASAAGATRGAATLSEAELLSQLLGEISRLKSELGEDK